MPAGFGFVVNDRDEILLIQRGYGKNKGKWSLPGGNQDRGESLRRTAIRETREETGVSMGSVRLYYKGGNHRVEVWRGKRKGGHLKIQKSECLDAKWFQKDMLPADENLAFGPDKIALKNWASENPGSRRVHYPRSKMDRAGFALVVNDENEILLVRREHGRRKGKWSIPGGKPKSGESRQDAATRETHKATGIRFDSHRLYYENRHQAKIWIGKPKRSRISASSSQLNDNAAWFPIDRLPGDDSLAFAIDVRTIEKWANENRASRHPSYR